VPHLLVTNDYPPKIGGIQSYLHELWRRLPRGMATVYTTAYPGAKEWDRTAGLPVVRSDRSVLLPTPSLAQQLRRLAGETGSGLVLLDPALPLGLVGPQLGAPYGVVLHGAEVTVPGRLPGSRALLAHVLGGARCLVAAGGYPAAEARRAIDRGRRATVPPITVVPPGVDTARFRPLGERERRSARRHFGLPEEAVVVAGISRLVPRKGFDVLIRAVARLRLTRPELVLALGGAGRDERRLRQVAAAARVPVHWLGRLSEEDLPLAYGCADVYAMCCRERWLGLEQEGFGIVFLEAAACGVPQVAGASGGAAEAVEDQVTGVVVARPDDPRAVAAALGPLVDDRELRLRLARAARRRVEESFAYDGLARRLAEALVDAGG
jgi:phosphatidylinositol alpha-1,6-mannosyltransferase